MINIEKFYILSVLEGERLIKNVYEALRNGKNWNQTLLIITYNIIIIFFYLNIVNFFIY